ncbi:hypothetical protein [Micromonospora sp. DT31]|uniref:hypothetical protein n=1 Tax=Micromonospora sp. DT31 TaxID=3393434 RepID=UPI003CFB6176
MRLRPAGLLLAAVAAVLWALGMTVLQPLTEQVGPWPEVPPGNNAYWARDLRFVVIVGAVAGLVLAGGGNRRWSVPAVLLGGAWMAVDVAVDRADPTGTGFTVLLAVAGCAAVAGAAALAVRRQRGGRGRRALVATACVTGVSVLVAAAIESPTDRETELNWAAVVTSLLLLALTLACALAAAPRWHPARQRLAVGIGAAVTAAVLLVRAVPPDSRILPGVLLVTVLLTGVTLLAWDWPDGRPVWRWHAFAALAALLGPHAMLLIVVIGTTLLNPGAPLTAMAGNTAISSADSDVLLSLSGVLAGLGMALLLAFPPALGYRPAGPERPDGPDEPEGQDGLRRASADRRQP